MENNLKCYLKNLALAQLLNTPIGEKLGQAIEMIQVVQNHFYAILEKQDELELTGAKAATIAAFAVLRKIAEGKSPSKFEADDWKDIAGAVSKFAILQSDQEYSVFIFSLFERYIRCSTGLITGVVPSKIVDTINALADELHHNAELLQEGIITEVKYTEDCLWVALEAMVKLLASAAVLLGDKRITDFSQAVASLAFEYGRLMLYRREQEIANQFIISQHQLDEELEHQYTLFLAELNNQVEQFYLLVENAFVPNFRDAFLQSTLLAKAAGVRDEDILSCREEIDHFFLV